MFILGCKHAPTMNAALQKHLEEKAAKLKVAGKGVITTNMVSQPTPPPSNQKKSKEIPPPPQSKRKADELVAEALKK